MSERWLGNRAESLRMLQEEADLQEIVRLVGLDAISARDRLLLETSRAIREAFLQQNAFHDVDTFTPLVKQYLMLDAILQFHHGALARLDEGVALEELLALPVRERIARMKFTPQDDEDDLQAVDGEIRAALEEMGAATVTGASQ